MEDCNFSNNSAYQGGAIVFQINSTATITNCKFIQNSAHVGAVIVASWNVSAYINTCTLEANTATDTVIYANELVTLHISHSQLIGNECKRGYIMTGFNQTLISFQKSRITSNKGDAIVLSRVSGYLKIIGSHMNDNKGNNMIVSDYS